MTAAPTAFPCEIFGQPTNPKRFSNSLSQKLPVPKRKLRRQLKLCVKPDEILRNLFMETTARVPKWDVIGDTVFQETGVLVLVRDMEELD